MHKMNCHKTVHILASNRGLHRLGVYVGRADELDRPLKDWIDRQIGRQTDTGRIGLCLGSRGCGRVKIL